jgi:hypothetical protein
MRLLFLLPFKTGNRHSVFVLIKLTGKKAKAGARNALPKKSVSDRALKICFFPHGAGTKTAPKKLGMGEL